MQEKTATNKPRREAGGQPFLRSLGGTHRAHTLTLDF